MTPLANKLQGCYSFESRTWGVFEMKVIHSCALRKQFSVPSCCIAWLSSKTWCGSKHLQRFPTLCKAKASLNVHPQLRGAKAVWSLIIKRKSFSSANVHAKQIRFCVNKLTIANLPHDAERRKESAKTYNLTTN